MYLRSGIPLLPAANCDCELYSIYLLQSILGLGLKRALMSNFVDFFKSLKKRHSHLLVLKDNSAERFYINVGWQRGPTLKLKLHGSTFQENSHVFDI